MFTCIARNVGIYSVCAAYYENKGDKLYFKKDYARAKDLYISAIEYGAGDRCKFHLASCYEQQGDITTALKWFYNVRNTKYEAEAIDKIGIYNATLIAKAANHIMEAEMLVDSNANNALAKLSEAENFLPITPRAQSLQERALFLRNKIQWRQEKYNLQNQIIQAKSIENLNKKVTALYNLEQHLSRYEAHFTPEEQQMFEETKELLKAAQLDYQKYKYLNMQANIWLKLQEFLQNLKRGDYNLAEYNLEEAARNYDNINPDNFTAKGHISLDKLKSAKLEVAEINREFVMRRNSRIPVIIDQLLNNAFKEINRIFMPNKQIKQALCSFFYENWVHLDQDFSSNDFLELKNEMTNIIKNELESEKFFFCAPACLSFRGRIALGVKDCELLKNKLQVCLDKYLKNNQKPMIKLDFLDYLKEQNLKIDESKLENIEANVVNSSSHKAFSLI